MYVLPTSINVSSPLFHRFCRLSGVAAKRNTLVKYSLNPGSIIELWVQASAARLGQGAAGRGARFMDVVPGGRGCGEELNCHDQSVANPVHLLIDF